MANPPGCWRPVTPGFQFCGLDSTSHSLYKIYNRRYRSGHEPRIENEDQEEAMLLRTADPFRDFDRLTQQLLGTTNRPAVMPMDAWREGDRFVIEFDLPGVSPRENRPRRRTQRADRPRRTGRPQRRLGDAGLRATARPVQPPTRPGRQPRPRPDRGRYEGGVLRLIVPVAEKAKPRKIQMISGTTPIGRPSKPERPSTREAEAGRPSLPGCPSWLTEDPSLLQTPAGRVRTLQIGAGSCRQRVSGPTSSTSTPTWRARSGRAA